MSTQSQVSARIEEHSVRISTDSSIHTKIWLSCVLGVALVLRIVALGTRSFWLDEAASTMLARVDWHTFVEAIIHRQANMALYYALLRGWVQMGSGESWTRLLSVIFGVAAIPVMYQLGKLVLGAKGGRIAALLLAVHAFHIEYSQEARGYSLAVFLALLSCYCFLKSLQLPSWRTWLAYALCSVLTAYAQVLGTLLLLTQWAYGACLRNSRKGALWASSMLAVFVSPLVFVLLFTSDRSQLAWMNQSSVSTLHALLLNFSGDGGTFLLVMETALLVCSAFFCFRKSSVTNKPGYTFLWLWALLPVVLLGAINLRWPVLQARYLIVCLPAFLLLVADGLTHLKSRAVFTAAFMAVVGLSIVGVSSYFRSRTDLNHSDNWRDASRHILSEAQPGDVVLFPYSAEEIAFREYQNRFARRGQFLVLVPKETDLELLSTAGQWMPPQLADSTASLHSRVWLISALQPNSPSRVVEAGVEAHLQALERRDFGFVTVQLFSGKAVTAP
jgi:mannosyltransferase